MRPMGRPRAPCRAEGRLRMGFCVQLPRRRHGGGDIRCAVSGGGWAELRAILEGVPLLQLWLWAPAVHHRCCLQTGAVD